jgi:hypothetical protein
MNKQFLQHVTATSRVVFFNDKLVVLNVGGTLDKLTGNAMEGSGRVLIWDNVPGIFIDGL